MSDRYYFSLRISGERGISKDMSSLPFSQVAEFLGEFSRLLGHKNQVRFNSLQKGSVLAVAEVADPETKASVEQRIAFAQSWQFPEERKPRTPTEVAAFDRLNAMAGKDGLTASIGCGSTVDETLSRVLIQLGQANEWQPMFLTQEGVLDGRVVRIGDSLAVSTADVPIHLQNWSGERYLCRADPETAFAMGSFPLGTYIRVRGSGEWSKEPRRPWRVKYFYIKSYEALPLQKGFMATIERLRATGLARKLSQMEDPEGYLNSLREGRTD